MTLDLSKYKAWRAENYDEPQVLVSFEIKQIIGTEQGGVSEEDIKTELAGWAPRVCKLASDYQDASRQRFSYVSNKENNDDPKDIFIYQEASGWWDEEFKASMTKLKLKKIVQDGKHKLVDENPNCDDVWGWKILRWEVLYDIVTNPFAVDGDPRKLFCDDVTWLKTVEGVDITMITRHGWREYRPV